MLKHVVAHRSSSSLGGGHPHSPHFSSPVLSLPPRRSSLTAVETKAGNSASCRRLLYRRADSCGSEGRHSPPSVLYPPQIREEETVSCLRGAGSAANVGDAHKTDGDSRFSVQRKVLHSQSVQRLRDYHESRSPERDHYSMESWSATPSCPRTRLSLSRLPLQNEVGNPTSERKYSVSGTANGSYSPLQPPLKTHPETPISPSSVTREDHRKPVVDISNQHPRQNPPILPKPTYEPSMTPHQSYTDTMPLSKSCTLPRRELFLPDNDVRRASFRSNASSCSMLSSASCSSLISAKHLNSRSTSTSSLLEMVPVKVYLRRLRSDMEYKTVSLSLQTTCKELVLLLLNKFRLRHRDPNLFFVLMEVAVRAPSDGGGPVRRQLVLEDNARPAELQQCRPKGEANFSIGVRRGGLVRVHDSILMPGSQYKSMMIACNTTADELVQLMLRCYNSSESPLNYALHLVCKNPYNDRPMNSKECPLKVQWSLPSGDRNNWAFILRRNLSYAFSLKSRMSWRRSLDQSSTDTESELDDSVIGGNRLFSSVGSPSSTPDSRSSSVSSNSSVSSSSSSTTSSDKSLDSGYLGSPLSGVRPPLPLPPKPKNIAQNREENKSSNSKSTECPDLKKSALSEDSKSPKKEDQPQNSDPSKEPRGTTQKSVLPVTPSVSKLSVNSSLPNIAVTTSSSSKTSKPVQKTIITITSTIRQCPSSQGSGELQRRHLRPVVPPPTLKISPNLQPRPNGNPISSPTNVSNSSAPSPSSPLQVNQNTPSSSKEVPSARTSSPLSVQAEMELSSVIEALKALGERSVSEQNSTS